MGSHAILSVPGRPIREQSSSSTTTVAVVHEWIAARAGSEKVFEAFASTFPDADLIALSHAPGVDLDLGDRALRTTFLDTPWLRDRRGLTLPLMPLAWRVMGKAELRRRDLFPPCVCRIEPSCRRGCAPLLRAFARPLRLDTRARLSWVLAGTHSGAISSQADRSAGCPALDLDRRQQHCCCGPHSPVLGS
jgi:hypothetical protein